MDKRKKSKKVYGKDTHNWREEMKPLILAAACITVAIEQSKEASLIYQQIIEAWDRHDCKALLKDNLSLPVAEIKRWEKAVTENGEYELSFDVWTPLYERYNKSDDCRFLFESISQFIKVGFNRKSDMAKQEYKVVASNTAYLCLAVGIWTAGEYLKKHSKWEGETKIRIWEKVLNASVLKGIFSERLHRLHSRLFKIYGYRLSHDKKLINMARLWYLSRVVYSGPEACCISGHITELITVIHATN